MENRFKDFPCLYYLDKRVDKKNNIQFYAMLASMFGQTPEQAVQSSKLFAHASGKLFNGVGFSAEEISHDAGNAFTKPYKDCRGFYRKKAYSEAGLKDNCCLICPYSHSYANNGIDNERQVLRILMEHRDWSEVVGCSTVDFKSYLALSCTNDISEYPIIPFNAMLFECIMQNTDVDIEKIVNFVRDALLAKGHVVSETLLHSFVSLQLDIIKRTALLSGDDISSLCFAVGTLRDGIYTPPQLVHLASNGGSDAGKRSETVSKKVNNLVQLFQDYENIEFVEKEPVTKGTGDAVEALLQSLEEPSVAPEVIEKTSLKPENMEKLGEVEKPTGMDNLDMLLDFLSSPVDESPNNVSYSCVETIDETDSYIEGGEATAATGNIVIEEAEEDDAEEDTALADSIKKSQTSIQESTTLLDESEKNEAELPEEESEQEDTKIIDTCFLCHKPLLKDDEFENVSMHELYQHCMNCEKAYREATDKPVFTQPVLHLPSAAGCALSSDAEPTCIYSSTPVQLSEEFIDNILDCSEFSGNLKNLVMFIEASNEADHISVECVQYHGIEGLLFYINGAYYFITGGYTTNATLKKLFADASEHSFYAMNPILVHVKLSHFGIRRAKIESLAVLYSVFVGTNFLLPPALFFKLDYSIDIYRSIMPQYASFFTGIELAEDEQKRYTQLKRLEWGLASSVDTSFISFGKNKSVYGSNALNYRFSMFKSERICREGVLLIVSLAEDSALPPEEAKTYWEDVVGRLASSSLSCMNYSFLLSLGEGVSYFTYFEEDAFYDSLMTSARSAYKKRYKKEVHLNVVKEQYVTN